MPNVGSIKGIQSRINQRILLEIEQGSFSEDLVHEAVAAATASGEIEHLSLLLKACASTLMPTLNLSLSVSSSRGATVAVRCLLDHGADVHYQGDRPLLRAIRTARTEVISLLLERGADPNVENGAPLRRLGSGYVLGTIEESRCKSILSSLLDAGADLEKALGDCSKVHVKPLRNLLSLCSIIAPDKADPHWLAAGNLVVKIGELANQIEPPNPSEGSVPSLMERREELAKLHREIARLALKFEKPDHVVSSVIMSECMT